MNQDKHEIGCSACDSKVEIYFFQDGKYVGSSYWTPERARKAAEILIKAAEAAEQKGKIDDADPQG